MTIDDRTPVLVGVGTAAQRLDDPTEAKEAVGLMADALAAAADDAGSNSLIDRLDQVRVTQGTWGYADPARWVADEVGATQARSYLGDVGILQTAVMGDAAAAIASGSADVIAVVGGEAKYRGLRASITGIEAPDTDQGGAEPDDFVTPHGMIISRAEIDTGLVMATHHYAMIENARRFADGQSVEEHRDEVAGTVGPLRPGGRGKTPMPGSETVWTPPPSPLPRTATGCWLGPTPSGTTPSGTWTRQPR